VRDDGEAVAVGTYDATASVYDAAGERQLEFTADNVVTGVAFLQDGSLLVSSDDRQLYRVGPDASVVWSLPLRRAVTGVAASQDGARVLALLKGDPKAYLFDQDGQPQGELEIGIQPRKADLSDNGEWIALGGADQYVYVMDGSLEQVGKHSINGTIDALTITDEGRVVVGSSTGSVVILEPDGSRIEFSAADAVTAVAATADGRYIAVSDFSGNDYVLGGDGELLWRASGSPDSAGRAIAVSPDGDALYKGSATGVVERIDIGSAIDAGRQQTLVTRILVIAGAVVALGALAGLFLYLRRKQRLGLLRTMWRERSSYLMLLPTFALISVFLYFPAFSGLFHSFYDWNPGGRSTFVGLANYERMLGDPYVTKGLGNLLLLLAAGLFKTVVPPLFVAELIYYLRSKRSQYWFRTGFVTSMIIPSVAGLLIWQNFYDPNVGLLNQALRAIGLGEWAHSWLGDPGTAIWAIIFMGFPFIGILSLLIFYAGLIAIPQDMVESAKIDGAGTATIIRALHLPMLAGQIKLLVILAFIGIIQDFGSILIVTGGGPLDSTYVPALQMYYAATQFNDLGYASALGVAMFVVILTLTVINMRFIRTSAD